MRILNLICTVEGSAYFSRCPPAIDWVFSGLDGWHAGGVYAGGFHGPAVVNHYYGGGCWNCGGAAIAGAAIGAAAVGLAGGSLVATVPAGCPYQVVGGTNYYVCNGTWYQPYSGNNGLYYRVVTPL